MVRIDPERLQAQGYLLLLPKRVMGLWGRLVEREGRVIRLQLALVWVAHWAPNKVFYRALVYTCRFIRDNWVCLNREGVVQVYLFIFLKVLHALNVLDWDKWILRTWQKRFFRLDHLLKPHFPINLRFFRWILHAPLELVLNAWIDLELTWYIRVVHFLSKFHIVFLLFNLLRPLPRHFDVVQRSVDCFHICVLRFRIDQ